MRLKQYALLALLVCALTGCGGPSYAEVSEADELSTSLEERAAVSATLIVAMYERAGRLEIEKFLTANPEWSVTRISGGSSHRCYALLVKEKTE